MTPTPVAANNHVGLLPHDHFHSCQQLRGSAATSRHNRILKLLGQMVREVGCSWWAEPRDLHGNSLGESIDLRPDAIVTTHDARMVDVSVINPTSES